MPLRTFVLVALLPLACTGLAARGGSASSSSGMVEQQDAGGADAGPARCDGGPCQATSLVATLGTASVTLDVAYLGLERSDAGLALYVEAYRGASAGCPQANSPTPSQTLVLANVPVVPVGTVVTYADGVRASLLDFRGDLFNSLAPARAETLQLTVRDVETRSPMGALLVVDVEGTLVGGGTLHGTLTATHCDSLDL